MASVRTLVLATRNPGKVREIRSLLSGLPVEVKPVGEFEDVGEPVEDGPTFAAIARDKAAFYARRTGQWCLADDSGLEVDALDGAPGIRSARFAADEVPDGAGRPEIDRANNAKLLRLLDGVADADRSARFVCCLALASPERIVIETFDTCEGRIAREGRGENGFGYDPIFYLPDRGCTVAELTAEQKL